MINLKKERGTKGNLSVRNHPPAQGCPSCGPVPSSFSVPLRGAFLCAGIHLRCREGPVFSAPMFLKLSLPPLVQVSQFLGLMSSDKVSVPSSLLGGKEGHPHMSVLSASKHYLGNW